MRWACSSATEPIRSTPAVTLCVRVLIVWSAVKGRRRQPRNAMSWRRKWTKSTENWRSWTRPRKRRWKTSRKRASECAWQSVDVVPRSVDRLAEFNFWYKASSGSSWPNLYTVVELCWQAWKIRFPVIFCNSSSERLIVVLSALWQRETHFIRR